MAYQVCYRVGLPSSWGALNENSVTAVELACDFSLLII